MRAELKPGLPNIDPVLVKAILDKVGREDRTEKIPATVSFDTVYSQLSEKEADVIKLLLEIDPKTLGFLGPFVSLEEAPHDLVPIEPQQFTRGEDTIIIPTQYLPAHAWGAFANLADDIKRDIDRRLMVESGYRSPACQAIVFLTYLEMNKFDIRYTASGVALPGYSQHGDPHHTALDVINQDGIPNDETPQDFARTPEYGWLDRNAGKYNFYQSYPEGNEFGVKFEPWHWQYRPKNT